MRFALITTCPFPTKQIYIFNKLKNAYMGKDLLDQKGCGSNKCKNHHRIIGISDNVAVKCIELRDQPKRLWGYVKWIDSHYDDIDPTLVDNPFFQ